MEGVTGSDGIDKPWDHAWSTEEMRKHRRDWSLAGDSGLLKHLQQFSENITKKAAETQEALNSMTAQLNETAILVDNITNTSLALANTQFIESRVQEDNIEIEQPPQDVKKNEDDHEFSATDLLVSVCESIKKGLSIMDEKYEKVEVLASDSEDEDDNPVPSVILRPKDPYQDRPLPYVIGTDQWESSSKVGLESSSSESEQNDEDEDSVSDTDDKNVPNILNTNVRIGGIGRLSPSTSSESNDYNVESSSIKDTDNSRLHARSQDTLNSDTEPTTPSSILPKTQHINNGPPSFAEELAKRLGNVLPPQKNVIAQDANEQITNRAKDDIFTPEDDQDVFNNKSDNLFNKGENLFSDEVSSSSWKTKPIKPVNKNIIPPSIDIPPPLTQISSAPKSTIDDLFGDANDSEDSDDIFSKKSSKNLFAPEKETVRSEILSKQKNPHLENVQNISTMTTSTPEMNDKAKGLFSDEDDDDLFASATKQIKPPDTSSSSSGTTKKKPIGGVSIFGGQVDVLSSNRFARRPSSSSSSSADLTDQRVQSNNSATAKSNDSVVGGTMSSLEAGNNAAASNSTATMSNTENSSGVSMRQQSIDNTAGSSLGADFQPLMSSSRLKSEEIFRERVASDSLFKNSSRSNVSDQPPQQRQQQQQQPVPQVEDVSEHEDVFGPPPLPKADAPKTKSKVASLFDDSDSGDDLFAPSASPSTRSLRSSERTPSKNQQQILPQTQSQPPPKKKSLFDDDDDLFGGPKEAPDVDLFGAAPVKSISKIGEGLFDDADKPPADDLFSEKPKVKSSGGVTSLFGGKEEKDELFGSINNTKEESLFDEVKKSEEKSKENEKESGLFREPAKIEKKKTAKGLFDDTEDSSESDLFAKVPKLPVADKNTSSYSGSAKSLFEDDSDNDLFGSSSKNILEKNIVEKSSDSLFSDSKEQSDLFGSRSAKAAEVPKKESPTGLFEEKSKVPTKPKKLTTSIFDDSDDDDLFGGSSLAKKNTSSSIFREDKKMEDEKKVEPEKNEEEKSKEEQLQETPKIAAKLAEKTSIFDDDDEDDDLFGDNKKKQALLNEKPIEQKSSKSEDAVKKEDKVDAVKPAQKPELAAKPEVVPKKAAMLAEIKQKLEKHRTEQQEKPSPKPSDSSVVDGAIISKKEPPKSLKLQTQLPMPVADEPVTPTTAAPKKPAVSGKIKNLMGKMGDLKILSPTDTPPLWRKSTEDKSANEDEEAAGETVNSEPSTPSLGSGGSSPRTSGTNSRARDSPSLRSDNTEVAISFDEPVQVETLDSIASKSRARIPAKRRPQSRQARQSALRYSGIDFDYVDATATSPTNEQQPNGDVTDIQITVDRLQPSRTQTSENSRPDVSHTDDKSELSPSRNTTTNLLSPSTDEEDLFDVPPDLPEDPAAKEDSLFGRAPILSPIETVEKPKKKAEPEEGSSGEKVEESCKEEDKKIEENEETNREPLDPLRDDSHDPLKDPSQLFAFVTKTPSPEKNKGLLLSEDDDSLFSSSSKSIEKPTEKKSKPGLDLFVDDDDASGTDLFSTSKVIKKKPLKDTKIDFTTPEDDDDSLFGSTTKKSKASSPAPTVAPKVEEKTDSKSAKTAVTDIFNDSSDNDDLFAGSKKTIPKKKATSLFDDDGDSADDDDDIFAKPKMSSSSSLKESKAAVDNGRPVVKKAVTRDLKKTAEKIVEDPLSMLQDD